MASLFALIASVMWGCSYFVGGSLSRDVSAYAVTAVSSAVTAAFFLLAGTVQGRLSFDAIDIGTGVVAGITTLVANVCLFTALTKGPMGIVGGISALLVVVPLMWSVQQGDPLTAIALVGVLLTMGGVILLGQRQMQGTLTRAAVVLALLSALFFGIQQVSIAEGSEDDAYVTLFLAQAFVVLLLGLTGMARRTWGGLSTRSLIPLVFVGLANAVAFAAFAEGTRIGDPGLVSALASLDPVVLALLAFVILKQRMARVQVLALGAVVVGGTCIALA